MAKFSDYETGKRVRLKAARAGGTVRTLRDGRVAFTSIYWNVAGSCQRPVLVEGRYRRYGNVHVSHGGKPVTLHTEIDTRCRKCAACLRARSYHWSQRAVSEWRNAPRTWLVTLTFKPGIAHQALARARAALGAQGVDFETLASKDRFDAHVRELAPEVTKFLKRLRTGKRGSSGGTPGKGWEHPPAAFRYLLVCEAHKSGVPHFHVLLHEADAETPVRQASIYTAWTAGFCDAKLVKDQIGASYATKYLAKGNLARVRASVAYGEVPARPHAIATTVKREAEPGSGNAHKSSTKDGQ